MILKASNTQATHFQTESPDQISSSPKFGLPTKISTPDVEVSE